MIGWISSIVSNQKSNIKKNIKKAIIKVDLIFLGAHANTIVTIIVKIIL